MSTPGQSAGGDSIEIPGVEGSPSPQTILSAAGSPPSTVRRQTFYVEEDSSEEEGQEFDPKIQAPSQIVPSFEHPSSSSRFSGGQFSIGGRFRPQHSQFNPHFLRASAEYLPDFDEDEEFLSVLLGQNLTVDEKSGSETSPKDPGQGQNPNLTAQYSSPQFPPATFAKKFSLEEITGQKPFDQFDESELFAGPSSSAYGHEAAGGYPGDVGRGAHFGLEGDPDSQEIMQISDDQLITRQKPPKIVYGYLFGSDIGSGSYARVKDCLHVKTLCRRAVKILKIERLKRILHAFNDVKRELRLLSKLRHNHVIRMYEYHWSKSKNKLYIFLEFCVISLQQLLQTANQQRLADWQSRFYFIQLMDGIDYLHSKGVCHKDIKPGNLLLTVDHVLKIVDFGVSDELDPFQADFNTTYTRGTPQFTSPEVARGQRSFDGRLVDVWCSGVTLFNMVSGLYPYEGETLFILYDNISNLPVIIPDHVILDERLRDLLSRMLDKDPSQRYHVTDILKHDWILRAQPKNPLNEHPLPRKDMDDMLKYAMNLTMSNNCIVIND